MIVIHDAGDWDIDCNAPMSPTCYVIVVPLKNVTQEDLANYSGSSPEREGQKIRRNDKKNPQENYRFLGLYT